VGSNRIVEGWGDGTGNGLGVGARDGTAVGADGAGEMLGPFVGYPQRVSSMTGATVPEITNRPPVVTRSSPDALTL